MAWLNNPSFTVFDAVQRDFDVYEVLVQDWGTMANAGDFSCMQWPPAGDVPVPVSLAGIAIGPRSTVDRCWLTYNLLKPNTDPSFGPTNRLRRLSVDTPIILATPTTPGAKNTPGTRRDTTNIMTQKGSLYIFPFAGYQTGPNTQLTEPTGYNYNYPVQQETTVLPQTYTDVNQITRALAPKDEVISSAMLPLLHLYLYLKTPIVYTPTKRFPMQVQGTILGVTPGSEQIVAQIPTYGRKTLRIMMMSNVLSSFRIGALRTISGLAGMQEQPVDSATAVAANTPTIMSQCALAECADYINLYANVSDVGGPPTVTFQLTAYD